MVAEEVRRHLPWAAGRAAGSRTPSVRPVPLIQGVPPVAQQAAGAEDRERLRRVAHVLADTQVQISRTLESSLQQLDDLVVQAETTAEKIRSILRRTEPSRERTRPGGP